MRYGATLAMISVLAIAASAGAQSQSSQTSASQAGSGTPATGMAETGDAAPGQAMTVQAYVTNAALSDLYEIESSRLAQQKARSAPIRQFAQQMITDHTATTAQLKTTLSRASLSAPAPARLDSRRQGMLDRLTSLTGQEFEKAYLDQQTMAHQEALALHSGYARSGDNDALKAFASSVAPKIEHHFGMVKQLDTNGADGTH